MRILVLGAGGTGGYFGGRLAAAGVDVTFLVRPARAAVLERNGLVITSPLGNATIPVRVVTKAGGAFDVILLSCKAYDIDSAMDAIAPAIGSSTLVLPLLNGLRHLDVLDARFGARHVPGGLCHIGATTTAAGGIHHLNRLQRLTLGPRLPEQAAATRSLHELLQRGGFDTVYSDDILQDMWEKFVFITAYAGMTTLFRTSIGAILAADEGEALMLEMAQECTRTAAANGHAPRPAAHREMTGSLTDRGSRGTSSMLRDMRSTSLTEHEHIMGDMLARARAAGVQAPLLRVALANMQACEASRRGSTGR